MTDVKITQVTLVLASYTPLPFGAAQTGIRLALMLSLQ